MNRNTYFTQVLDSFRNNKGKSSLYCFDDGVVFELVYNAITKILNKTPSANIFIVLNDYRMRMRLVSYLKDKSLDMTNIKLLTEQFINGRYHYAYHFTIIIGVNNYDIIKHLTDESKFTLCILIQNIMNNEFINNVRSILPNIMVTDISATIAVDRLTSPVEEHRYGVDLSVDDAEQYSKYDDYITNCISIFGSLDVIEKCKIGVPNLGISAAEFRDSFAKQNGWSETLNTNIDYLKQIDDTYNPNALYEKAYNFFNIAKKRRDFVSDNEAKFQTILDIVLANLDKHILIVSKRGEYAAKITKYINDNQTQIKCGDYHDCIEDAIATDMTGNVILYKSGVNKGKPKIVKSAAQSTLNERLFNNQIINALSIKEASDTKLNIACNCVIFTSALCNSIRDLKLRFTNINFGAGTLQTYRVYCNNTIEQVKINKDKPLPFVNYIDETENNFDYDENINGIVL
jgi:hypothetical protein